MRAHMLIQRRFGDVVLGEGPVGALQRFTKVLRVGRYLEIRQRQLVIRARRYPLLPQGVVFRADHTAIVPSGGMPVHRKFNVREFA